MICGELIVRWCHLAASEGISTSSVFFLYVTAQQ